VGVGDVNGDDIAEVLTGTERGAPRVNVFDGRNGTLLSSFFAYASRLGSGVYVAGVSPHASGR
jgi:hypothetical protein